MVDKRAIRYEKGIRRDDGRALDNETERRMSKINVQGGMTSVEWNVVAERHFEGRSDHATYWQWRETARCETRIWCRMFGYNYLSWNDSLVSLRTSARVCRIMPRTSAAIWWWRWKLCVASVLGKFACSCCDGSGASSNSGLDSIRGWKVYSMVEKRHMRRNLINDCTLLAGFWRWWLSVWSIGTELDVHRILIGCAVLCRLGRLRTT